MQMRRLIAAFLPALIALSLPPSVGAQEEGAKGLYFEQLEQPTRDLNTGVQYWIELHRARQVMRVTNKHSFKSGDQIRFHVKANINGYAYIVLRSGSQGEQSVLFPEPGEDNRVRSGRDYALPKDGFLTFDSNPGLEKVTLLLSRTPLDAQAYLEKRDASETTLIASAMPGSKDLIPSKIVLAYSTPATAPINIPGGQKQKTSGQTKTPSGHKPASPAKKPARTAVAAAPPKRPQARPQASSPATASTGAVSPALSAEGGDQSALVTVVNRDPSQVLAVEVDLEHHL